MRKLERENGTIEIWQDIMPNIVLARIIPDSVLKGAPPPELQGGRLGT